MFNDYTWNSKGEKNIRIKSFGKEKIRITVIPTILVDGTKEVIPSPNGYYKDETLNWLDKQLTKYEKENVVILQHYPISDVSENSLQNLYKPQLYKDVIAKHKNIVAVFAGHYHINREELIDNVMYLTTDAARGGTYRKIFLTPVENNKIEVYSQNIKF